MNDEVKVGELDNLSAHNHNMIHNDMKYRGPLSYRGLRVLAWVSLAVISSP